MNGLQQRCFNPRTREGCDIICSFLPSTITAFQSTHPRGVRRQWFYPVVPGASGFNPRTREGCDSQSVFDRCHPSGFQSTHPRGVRPLPRSTTSPLPMFQSTHPRGVRRNGGGSSPTKPAVSIHAPARGATGFKSRLRHHNFSFNPRTREGCDDILGNTFPIPLNVSIHAPARGATFQLWGRQQGLSVSIHAPARGATLEDAVTNTKVGVSIHAPARGATLVPLFLPLF